jgi:hypothetical protein
LLASWAGLSGCVGPKAVRYTRIPYNEVVHDTNDEQLLLNIVRLRYADSVVFIDLPNITSQFELAGRGNYFGGFGNQYHGQSNLGFGELSMRDTPTLSYHPREGREIAKALLTPISADLFNVINGGADIEQLMLFCVSDINDVSNARGATLLTPRIAEDNSAFVQGIRLLEFLKERDGIELGIETDEEAAGASDPIAKSNVEGRDLVNAAKDGYVYRARGDDQIALLKRDKELVIRIRRAYIHSPEMEEAERIFGLMPGQTKYRVKSELSEEADRTMPLGNDTIFLNMRSVLQVMMFLSKGVCIPDDHMLSGLAPLTPGPDGMPFDWTQITAGNFMVHAQKHRPKNAEVAVKYRGYWFYIAANDVKSRAALAFLAMLFALQESNGKSVGPLLTLPVGG